MAEFSEIKQVQELEEIFDASSHRKVLLFKHSTTCPISARAWREIQAIIQESSDEVLVAQVKVIESRPVSNQVAAELGVKHESPQALLVHQRQVIWHASHHNVTKEAIQKVLKE